MCCFLVCVNTGAGAGVHAGAGGFYIFFPFFFPFCCCFCLGSDTFWRRPQPSPGDHDEMGCAMDYSCIPGVGVLGILGYPSEVLTNIPTGMHEEFRTPHLALVPRSARVLSSNRILYIYDVYA